jgi:hypothetical protein
MKRWLFRLPSAAQRATGESGRQHPRGGGYRRERRSFWETRRESRVERFPQASLRRAVGEWSAHSLGRTDGSFASDEITLAQQVAPALQKGMLCLADRLFPSYHLWQATIRTQILTCGTVPLRGKQCA